MYFQSQKVHCTSKHTFTAGHVDSSFKRSADVSNIICLTACVFGQKKKRLGDLLTN